MKYCKSILRLLAAALCLLTAESASPAASPADESPNLIKNPGFETTKSFGPWGGRNWWSRKVAKPGGGEVVETNEFSFSLDKQNPHSGTQCVKISIAKHLGADIQFFQNLPEIAPGMPLRLSFWLRGQANSQPVAVEFRRNSAPWTTFFGATAQLTEEWKEYVFNLTLPPQTSARDCSLMFHLSEANTFWLDDVAVRMLPAVEPVVPPDGNQVANGSFEAGRDKWYATFRENASPYSMDASENNCAADIKSIILPDAPAGRRVLSVEVFPKCSMALTSAFFPLKYGHEATIEFSLKTSNPEKDQISVSLLCGEYPNIVAENKIFKCAGTGWQRMSFKVRPKPSTSGSYMLCFSTGTPGIYSIDDIRVWQGSPEKSGERTAPDVGWEPVDDKHPANFFVKGETPVFKLLVKSGTNAKSIALKGNIVDTWEREIAKLDIDIPLDSTGTGEAILKLPECTLYGTFKASLHAPGSREPSVEILYSVPHEQSTLVSAEDSFFGGHVNFSPYNLLLAQKAGFRWLRLHPPNDAKWYMCESEKGRLVFRTEGAARAGAMGFKLLGNLDSVPEFYADKPAKGTQSWYSSYPPKGEDGWKAYEAYVAGAAKAFAPYINTWEICNEPDGGFLQVPQGMLREEIYMEYVRRTNKALRDRKDITLIGGAVSSTSRPLMGQILKLGLGNYVDAISFHCYGHLATAETLAATLKDWRTYKNRDGASMPIWHTEGFGELGFGSESVTWMSTTGHPYKDSTTFHQQWKTSGMNIQNILIFKELGIKKHFIYAAFAQPSGHIIFRSECSFMADINGLPKSCLTAHAAAVYFLDGAEPKGLDFKKAGSAGYWLASFVRDGKKLDAVWSDIEMNMNTIPELRPLLAGRKAFDMMGNPIKAKTDLRLSAAPVYLLEE